MTYLLDTNIVLAFVRNSPVAHGVTAILALTDTNRVFISIVTAGELWSIANQSAWGEAKRNQLHQVLGEYAQLAVSDEALLYRYADIDAFSQNKLADKPLGMSARNMGKNDLWIAATASLQGASLITTDKDFDHLHGQFVEVIWIDPAKNS